MEVLRKKNLYEPENCFQMIDKKIRMEAITK